MAEALTFDDLLRFHREVLMPEFAAVRNDLGSEIAAAGNDISSEIAAVRNDLTSEIAAVRNDLGDEIAAVRNDLGDKIGAVRNDLHSEIAAAQGGVHDEIVTARNDFARHLTAQTDGVRVELRSFRGEFETFRRDVLTHFDRIYHRLESDAFEFQALKAAVARFERPDRD